MRHKDKKNKLRSAGTDLQVRFREVCPYRKGGLLWLNRCKDTFFKPLQGSKSTSWLLKHGEVKAQGTFSNGPFTVSYSFDGTKRAGEVIKCRKDYSSFSFPLGTRVTFSIPLIEEESLETPGPSGFEVVHATDEEKRPISVDDDSSSSSGEASSDSDDDDDESKSQSSVDESSGGSETVGDDESRTGDESRTTDETIGRCTKRADVENSRRGDECRVVHMEKNDRHSDTEERTNTEERKGDGVRLAGEKGECSRNPEKNKTGVSEKSNKKTDDGSEGSGSCAESQVVVQNADESDGEGRAHNADEDEGSGVAQTTGTKRKTRRRPGDKTRGKKPRSALRGKISIELVFNLMTKLQLELNP